MSEEALADADRSLELDFSKENIKAALGFRGLGFGGLGFRGLGFRGLGV